HISVAVAHGARLQACGVRSRVGLGQAVAREMLHGAEPGQKFLPLRLARKSVDHPRRHVVDRDIGGGRGTALRELLEDERRIEPRQRRAADVVLYIDAAEAERRGRAQRFDRKSRILIPVARMRHHFAACELTRGVLYRALLFGKLKVHTVAYSRGVPPRQLFVTHDLFRKPVSIPDHVRDMLFRIMRYPNIQAQGSATGRPSLSASRPLMVRISDQTNHQAHTRKPTSTISSSAPTIR